MSYINHLENICTENCTTIAYFILNCTLAVPEGVTPDKSGDSRIRVAPGVPLLCSAFMRPILRYRFQCLIQYTLHNWRGASCKVVRIRITRSPRFRRSWTRANHSLGLGWVQSWKWSISSNRINPTLVEASRGRDISRSGFPQNGEIEVLRGSGATIPPLTVKRTTNPILKVKLLRWMFVAR